MLPQRQYYRIFAGERCDLVDERLVNLLMLVFLETRLAALQFFSFARPKSL